MKFEVFTWEAGKRPKSVGNALLTPDGFFADSSRVGLYLEATALPQIARTSVAAYLESRFNRDDAAYHLKLLPEIDLYSLRVVGYSKYQSRLYGFDGRYCTARADLTELPEMYDARPMLDEHIGRSVLGYTPEIPAPVGPWELFDGSIYKHLPVDFVALTEPMPRVY